VLTLAQVQAEFPALPLDPDATGYQDNEAAANNSLDPDDSGPDLAARGRLDGYQASFFDPVSIFGGSSSGDQPIVAELSVHLFSNSGAAQAFIRQSRIFAGCKTRRLERGSPSVSSHHSPPRQWVQTHWRGAMISP
jgi:hypothetical protein